MLQSLTSQDALASQPAPDEAHARQLSDGFGALRFEPALEAEYRQSLGREQLGPAIICAWLALFIWTGFVAYDLIRLDVFNQGVAYADMWLLLIGRWSVLLVLAMALISVSTPLRERLPVGAVAFWVFSVVGLIAALNAVIYKSHGMEAADTALVVVVMAAFLPLAMTFYAALIAALIPAVVATLAGIIWLDTSQFTQHLGQVVMLFIAVPVGAVGAYLRERAHRHQFLLTAILSRQAQADPLTDLANRRLFEHHADTAIAHAARNGHEIVLAIIDIDHFKAFNDRNGHAAGDIALCQVASVIHQAARRPMDLAARLGGEEFALLLYDCNMNRARPVLEALRGRVSDIALSPGEAAPLTISISATSPTSGEDLDTIYDRADQLLYTSKSSGRDRLTTG
ncbi:GGDEF domain-containing protein [Devosia sp. J2-20]|uniref:GGDEF domain-containing protein n=1 Tax=Devosia sp. J2-20 TaxID=3026161 RepID=UPI00249C8AF0|nr:GGDEF domain-containing protein [Devosia sp. J2-20]WDQ99894.1 GGDEF domain-containing protein [Devosia sp. J2-20]